MAKKPLDPGGAEAPDTAPPAPKRAGLLYGYRKGRPLVTGDKAVGKAKPKSKLPSLLYPGAAPKPLAPPSAEVVTLHPALDLRATLNALPGWANKSAGERARELTALAGAYLEEDRATWPKPPATAPLTWTADGKGKVASAAVFTRDVYKRWIGKGFNRAWLHDLDPPLYKALALYMTRHPHENFADLPDSTIDVEALMDRLGGLASEDEIRRAGLAIEARRQKAKKRME